MRLILLFTLLCLCPSLPAQVTVKVATNRSDYVAFEPVKVTVSIHNLAGRPLNLHNTFDKSWIEFVVRDQSGRAMSQIKKLAYPSVTIPMSQTVKSTFTINNAYDLSSPGNYSVYAVVRTPEQTKELGTRSTASFFTVNRGVVSWKTKVGVPGAAGDESEFRLINFSGDKVPELYIQVVDVKRGRILLTNTMGRILAFRKTLKAIDSNNHLHVLFLTTPEIYCHTVISPKGEITKRRYHKPIGSTQPTFLTSNDGGITVINSLPYNPDEEAKEQAKFHNLSELPGGFEQ